MITIKKPRIEKSDGLGGGVKLISHIVDDEHPIDEDIWFETEKENEIYFCDEVCDAFVVAMLLPAVKSGQDIECDVISEKLLYNLNHIVTCLLETAWGGRRIQIIAKNVTFVNFHGKGIGTGCSLGVDSFSVILSHTKYTTTSTYQLTHLTYFNVGAFGSDNPEQARESYLNDLKKVRAFASDYGLPLVTIESNIGITNNHSSFDQTVCFRNAAAALTMQKLFARYLNGSTIHVADFKITKDCYSYEALLTPMLSTESTELIVADGDKSRVDKERFIADNKLVQKHLLVCWREIFKNEWPQYWEQIKDIAYNHRNCTLCDKCLRTCVAFDLLGVLDNYKDIFDLKQYYNVKNAYIYKVVIKKDSDPFCADIYKLMIERNIIIPFKLKIALLAFSIKKRLVLTIKVLLFGRF